MRTSTSESSAGTGSRRRTVLDPSSSTLDRGTGGRVLFEGYAGMGKKRLLQ
jgi:hypothetical protein